MKKHSLHTAVLLMVFGLALALNYLSVTGLITPYTSKEISDRYQSLLTPAPLAFSIWSLIYLLLTLILLWWLKTQDVQLLRIQHRLFRPLLGAFVTNMLWITLFNNNYLGLSALVITLYFLFLLWIIREVKDEQNFWLIRVTFGLHAGWLLVASFMNFAAWFRKLRISYPLSLTTMVLLVLILVSLLAFWLVFYSHNPSVLVAVSWGFVMICKTHAAGTFHDLYPVVEYAAGGLALVLFLSFIILLAWPFFKKLRA
ncbi:hypothetical protein [Streptococcus halichoeri]|uniref:hypothetical protein n=1 Tax=Streptococcus halichoeri TaxID=254785 RepID=UPI001359CD63|nr:hypothetical protein [Streptococcus halichoeri]